MSEVIRTTSPHPLNPAEWDRTVYATEDGEVLYVEITLSRPATPEAAARTQALPNRWPRPLDGFLGLYERGRL
jgi:hypothetical protein